MYVDGDRLWSNVMRLGEIGRNELGGITRLSFTKTEVEAKRFVANLMKEAGLTVYQDEIGNLFGRKEGTEPGAPIVMIGSHIDSVINGGIFDGSAGVLAAIEVLHSLNERGWQGRHAIEVVAFTDEEGARFSTGMLGSKAIVGELTEQELEKKDEAEISVSEAMKQAGYDPEKITLAKRNPDSIKAYLELHIEQGKVLESKNLSVGIVTGIVGVRWFHVSLKGEAGHAGTTPMGLRKDPLVAAAKLINYLDEVAKKEESSVVTVGKVKVSPGGINIIPGEVDLTFDIRDVSNDKLDKIESELKRNLGTLSQEQGLTYNLRPLHRIKPAKCSSGLIKLFEKAVVEIGHEPFHLVSGAGHDAMTMANITDIGMIFVRSKDGISHNPKEWTNKEDLIEGTNALLIAAKKMADN